MTLEHILLDCYGYSVEMIIYKLGEHWDTVLSNNLNEIKKVLNFLKETNLYKQI